MQCVGTLSWSMIGFAAEEVARPSAAQTRPTQTGPTQAERLPREASTMELEGARLDLSSPDLSSPDWALLVRRCISGDPSAWTELVKSQHRRVYGICYRFTGNVTDAEDLTQDLFLKLYSNLQNFDTARGSLPVWITTMTRNMLVDNYRRNKNLRQTGSLDEGWEGSDDDGRQPLIERMESTGRNQHEIAAHRELEKMVQEALAQVSPDLREAVILRDLQDMDYREIAEVLNIPEGTVKSRISRGRAELAKLLERNRRQVM
jgi:RNA polymerase sigma-70 factor (ECF subfamily)